LFVYGSASERVIQEALPAAEAINQEDTVGDETEQAMRQLDVREWQNEWVFDEAGEPIGKISDVLLGADRKPEWMILSYGAFLRNDRLVPVFDMKQGEHGFVVSYSKDKVHHAPVVSVNNTSDKDEAELSAYWCTDMSASMPRTCSMLSKSA
jgi:hypothetical protein